MSDQSDLSATRLDIIADQLSEKLTEFEKQLSSKWFRIDCEIWDPDDPNFGIKFVREGKSYRLYALHKYKEFQRRYPEDYDPSEFATESPEYELVEGVNDCRLLSSSIRDRAKSVKLLPSLVERMRSTYKELRDAAAYALVKFPDVDTALDNAESGG